MQAYKRLTDQYFSVGRIVWFLVDAMAMPGSGLGMILVVIIAHIDTGDPSSGSL